MYVADNGAQPRAPLGSRLVCCLGLNWSTQTGTAAFLVYRMVRGFGNLRPRQLIELHDEPRVICDEEFGITNISFTALPRRTASKISYVNEQFRTKLNYYCVDTSAPRTVTTKPYWIINAAPPVR
jgi:hypothetical protein